MAPKRHGMKRKGKFSKSSRPKSVKRRKNIIAAEDDKQISPLKQNPVENYQVQLEESSSEDEVNPYQELVSSLDSAIKQTDCESEDSNDDSSDIDNIECKETKTIIHDSFSDDNIIEDESLDESSDEEEESDEEKEDHQNADPFLQHFEKEISEGQVNKLSKSDWHKSNLKIPTLGKCAARSVEETPLKPDTETDLWKMHVKLSLCNEIKETNKKYCCDKETLTPLQMMVFKILNKYQDLYYPCRTKDNGEQLRLIYCLHALNHVLKTRKRVISHNAKLKVPGSEDKEFRDQGLTRPKVLIVLPFRESALRVVNIMISLLKSDEKSLTSNKKRFYDEYLEDNTDQKKGLKPEDYESTFTGSTDDHFRIGLGVAKKTLKLYTEFYSSDIILASPLGLRTIIGSEGDRERDYDFLNSIELLIIDQADILLMQNWDHVMHLMKHLHLQPTESHGTDFSRVRMWTLNGWSKYYRQTLIFSSISAPQLGSIFNKCCFNNNGKIIVHRPESKGTISQVVTQLPQVFHKVSCNTYSQLADDRFNFFIQKILPTHKDPVLSQTFIYVPSYFDFVRLRNYFVREEISFMHISEYTKDKAVSRARNQFYHKNVHFMLYTERVHFYRRFKIRGIRHMIFYELPMYPHFYSELCNMLQETHQENTCTVLYSKYDIQKLSEVVGTDRAAHMVTSSKSVHMFVTGE